MYNNPFSIKSSGYSASGFSALANAYARINTKKQLFSAISNGNFNFGGGSAEELLAQLAAYMQNQMGNNAASSLLSSKLSSSGGSNMSMKDFENLVNQLLENEDLYKELEKVGYGLDNPTITDITNKFIDSVGGPSSALYKNLAEYMTRLQQAASLLNTASAALSAKDNTASMLSTIETLTETINNLSPDSDRAKIQKDINDLIKQLFETKNETTGIFGDKIFGETDTTIKITTGTENINYNQEDFANAQTQITTPFGTSGMTVLQAQQAGYTVVRSTDEFLDVINKAEEKAAKDGTTIDTKIMLFADIDLSGKNFDGIGKYTTSETVDGETVTTIKTIAFTGILDGNGYSIKNLELNAAGEANVGLIAKTDSKEVTEKDSEGNDVVKTVNAEVKNLTLENVKVTGGDYTGALIGSASNTNISNITIKDTTQEQNANQIIGENCVGGLVGNLENSTVNKVNAILNVTAANNNTGGIAGVASDSSFENVSVAGTLTTNSKTDEDDAFIADAISESQKIGVGGLVGLMSGSSDKAYIKNSYANVDITRNGEVTVSGKNYFEGTGGLVGIAMGTSAENSEVQILNSYSTGSVANAIKYTGDTSDYFAGHSATAGLIGYGYELIVENSYAKGDVFGGFATEEQIDKNGTQNSAGGLIGVLETGNVIASYATGDINTNGNYAGGFIGLASGEVTVDSSFAKGDVIAGKKSISGGFIGSTAGTAEITGLGIELSDITDKEFVEVSDVASLQAALANNQNIILTDNISLADVENWNIESYTGTLDGNNFTISDLTNSEGLIENANGATIKNLTIENFTITGNDSNTGALASCANGTMIDNVTVTGSRISSAYSSTGGLAGNICNTIITDSKIEESRVEQTGTAISTGGLVGSTNNSTISNSTSSANIIGAQYSGGLVGRTTSSYISNSSATGEVSGSSSTGGLVGYQEFGDISTSFATGSVSGTEKTGGLVGYQVSGSITSSYAEGAVTATSSYSGGLVGYQENGNISNSYSKGNVTGGPYVASFIGYSNYGNMNDCCALGTVTSTSGSATYGFAGGYNVEYNNCYYNADCENSYSYGVLGASSDMVQNHINSIDAIITASKTQQSDELIEVYNADQLFEALSNNQNVKLMDNIDLSDWTTSIASYSGSLDGNGFTISNLGKTNTINEGLFENANDATITNLTIKDFTITANDSYTGALASKAEDTTINGVKAENITINSSYAYTGGLVGYNSGSITSSSVSGTVSSTASYTGGLVGQNNGTIKYSSSSADVIGTVGSGQQDTGGLVGQNNGTISYSSAKGNVTGHEDTGGFVGQNSGTISNSYSTGNVNGNSYAGGFTGWHCGGSIDNSYSLGTVSANGSVNGFVTGSATVTNSYYNSTTSDSSNATKTTVETVQAGINTIDEAIANPVSDPAATVEIIEVDEAQELYNALKNNQNIILTGDISLAEYANNWDVTTYTGILDGNGFTISDLTNTEGLIENANNATIKDLTLNNFTITGDDYNTGA
ncbi:hypothetical protein IKA15_01570, partial [bacterium]|nr:hypothetical protein [bacterium]